MTLSAALFFLFVVATMAQIAVWQFLFGRLTRYKAGRYGLLPPFSTVRHNNTQHSTLNTQHSKLKPVPPPVSVIICARNEADNLRAFLPAILEQQYPDFEVIVVDDDSTDDTQTVLAALQRQYAHLRVLRLSPKTAPGKKQALEQGIKAARHEYLVFTDADCTPAGPGWLWGLVASPPSPIAINLREKGSHGVSTPPPSPPPKGRGAWSRFTFGIPNRDGWVKSGRAPLPFRGGDGGIAINLRSKGSHGVSTPPPSPPPKGRGAWSRFTFGIPNRDGWVEWGRAPLPFGGGVGGGVDTPGEPFSLKLMAMGGGGGVDTPCEPFSLKLMAMGDGGGAPITLGYAPYLPAPGLLNRWIRFETNYTAMLYFSFALAGWPYMGVGRNLAWHKSLFEKTGGFSSHAHIPSGDDDLFVNAAAHKRNTAICLAPESFMYSAAKRSWADWLRQKRRHLGAGKAYRPGHQMALAALTLTLVVHYFLLAALLFTDFGTVSVAFYAIRMALASGIYWNILRLFRDKQSLIWFPLLDALLATYYAVLVPLILIRSNYLISWK